MSGATNVGYLSDNVAIDVAYAYTGAGTATLTSAEFDMTGYTHALVICKFGTPAANNTVTLWNSAAASGEAATVATIGHATLTPLVLDCQNVPLRYVKVTIACGTSTTLEHATLIRYGARAKAVTPVATEKVSQWNAPALV